MPSPTLILILLSTHIGDGARPPHSTILKKPTFNANSMIQFLTDTQSVCLTDTQTQTKTHTDTHLHKHTHTPTYTNTHSLSLSLSVSFSLSLSLSLFLPPSLPLSLSLSLSLSHTHTHYSLSFSFPPTRFSSPFRTNHSGMGRQINDIFMCYRLAAEPPPWPSEAVGHGSLREASPEKRIMRSGM